MSHRQGNQRRMSGLSRSGFSLVELLVVIAVIVILLALLLPAIAASRATARTAQCARQMEQIGTSLTKAQLHRVAADPTLWTAKTAPYLDVAQNTIRCPDDLTGNSLSSYGINARASRFASGDSQKIVLVEYKQVVANVVGPQGTDDWPSLIASRHRGGLNVLSVDGSVHRRTPAEIDPRVCEIHDRLWRPIQDFSLLRPGCTRDVGLSPVTSSTTGGATTASGTTGGTTTSSNPCSVLSSPVTVTLMDNAPPVVEGNGGGVSIDFIVTLSQAVPADVTVDLAATPVEAQPGTDYVAMPVGAQVAGGVLTFPANSTMQTVRVNVIGDTIQETPVLETFRLAISNPRLAGLTCSNLSIGSSGQATGQITDDDSLPTWKKGYNLGGPQYITLDGTLYEDGTLARLSSLVSPSGHRYVESYDVSFGIVELNYSSLDILGTNDDLLYQTGYNSYGDNIPKKSFAFFLPVPQPGNYKITLCSFGTYKNRTFEFQFPDMPAANFQLSAPATPTGQLYLQSRTVTVVDGELNMDVWNLGADPPPNHPWTQAILIELLPCNPGGSGTPTVSAGQTLTLNGTPATATLPGAYFDGCPGGSGSVQWRWSVVSAPGGGSVSFNPSGATTYSSNSAALTPSTTFTGAGTYTLRLEVTNGSNTGSADVSVVVSDSNAALMARYKFNNPADPGQDSSGKGNHAIVAGTIYDGTEGGGCAANFSASNLIIAPDAVFANVTTDVSISLWAKSTLSSAAQSCLFYGANASAKKLNVYLPYNDSNVYWDALYSGSRINKLGSANDWGASAGWVHWAFTRTASTMNIYRNGALWHTGTPGTGTLSGVVNFCIGSQVGAIPYRGKIDDFRIYKRELDAAEINSQVAGGQNSP